MRLHVHPLQGAPGGSGNKRSVNLRLGGRGPRSRSAELSAAPGRSRLHALPIGDEGGLGDGFVQVDIWIRLENVGQAGAGSVCLVREDTKAVGAAAGHIISCFGGGLHRLLSFSAQVLRAVLGFWY